MHLYVLKEDDDHIGLKKGDVLECRPYWLDPELKLTVVRRVSDGWDPMCNVYRSQVERVVATRPAGLPPSEVVYGILMAESAQIKKGE